MTHSRPGEQARRDLVRQLQAEGDPRAAHLRRPGRPGATPEQRAADQRLVLNVLDQHGLTRKALSMALGVSKSTVGRVASGQRALSAATRKAIAGVAAKLAAGKSS